MTKLTGGASEHIMRTPFLIVPALTVAALFTTACHKKIAGVTTPPRPVPAATRDAARPSIALFTADPTAIDRGSSTTLRWSVKDATDVTITPALGAVQADGSRLISPSEDTTYTLVARGAGGSADAVTSVSVRIQSAGGPDQAMKERIEELLQRIQDAYFDYNKHVLRPDATKTLQDDAKTLADILRLYPNYKLTVEGNCDERGSDEYNLALGDARARSAREYLTSLGIPGDQLQVVSYGKNRPVCTEHDEACWQKNRRAHVTQEQIAQAR